MKRGLRPQSAIIDKHIKEEAIRRTGMKGIWDDKYGSFRQDHKYCYAKFEPIIRKHFEEGGGDGVMVIAGLCGTTHATINHWLDSESQFYKEEFHELIEECRGMAAAATDTWHRESANGDRPKANATTLNRRAEKILDMIPTVKTLNKLEDLETLQEEIDRIKDMQQQYGPIDERSDSTEK